MSDGESYVISKYKSYLNSKNVKFQSQCDQSENNALTFDKKKFFLFCQKNKIPVGKLNFFKNLNHLIGFLKKNKNQKYILKALKGSGTRNVFLINSKRLLGAEFLYWAYGIFIIFPMRAKNCFV